MNETRTPQISTGELLSQSGRMFRAHWRTFVPLMGFPVAAMFLSILVLYFLVAPIRPDVPLREVWLGMSVARKIGVALLFLITVAVINRALVASIFAVREFRDGREIGVLRALGFVRRKHLRLFWLLFLVGLFSAGPLVVVGMALTFFFASAFPMAALENLGVIGALRRSIKLTEGGYGRIAALLLLYLVLVVVGVFGLVGLGLLSSAPQFAARAWFWLWRLILALAFWSFLLIPQWYMIALTLNYFDQQARKGQSGAASPAA
jgi:hypothetical protein